MPAALDVDWNAVRVTFAATGSYAITARAHGIENAAVRQRAKREGWKLQRETALTEMSRPVTKPHEAMRNALEEIGEKIRSKGAKCAKKGLDAVYRLDGEHIAARAQSVKALIDAGEKACAGWGGGAQSTQPLIAIQLNGYVPAPSGMDSASEGHG